MAAMALLDYLNSNLIIAVLTGGLALVLLINSAYLRVRRHHQPKQILEWFFIAYLALFALVVIDQQHGEYLYWVYFFPIAAFFLFRLIVALFLLFAFIPLALFIIQTYAPPLTQAQSIYTFAAISTVALFLASVKSRTNKLLEPLISSDADTGAQLEKFLRPALTTEITRAEREGTGLLLMYISVDVFSATKNKDKQEAMIKMVAQTITSSLRLFDQYYRIQNNNFAVILPHTTSQEAFDNAKAMQQKMPIELQQQKIKIGLASLNVGDTAESMIVLARQGLKYVY